MKTMIKYFMAASLIIGFAACSEDKSTDGPPDNPRGKETTVILKVRDAIPGGYATNETKPPEAGESELAATLAVYIFDENGVFEYGDNALTFTGTGDTRTSAAFKVTAGFKFIYVFSNMPSDFAAPNNTISRSTFEQQVLTLAYTDVAKPEQPDISKNGALAIGTLWGERIEVEGTGTSTTPEPVGVEIGRLVARVNMGEVPAVGTSNLQGGAFTNGKVRLCSVPLSMYTVGQWQGTVKPPTGSNVVVKSWAHALDYNSRKQLAFATPDSFPTTSNIGTDIANAMYTIENTAEPDGSGNVTMGVTTYAQLEIVYTPVDAEVLDGTTGLPITGSFVGPTFWAGEKQDKTYIFDSKPVDGLGYTKLREYTDGKNYYEAVITDQSETNIPLCSHRVLRNHYYELNVKAIKALGRPTKWVEPGEIVKTPKDIELLITILPWAKIASDIEFP